MPLRKLWNSICGKTASGSSEPTETPISDQRSRGENSTTERAPLAQAPLAPAPQTQTPAKTRSLKTSVSRDDKKLFRRLESIGARSILQIGLGDGNRSLAMLHFLTHKGHSTPLHYIAIDEFELGNGALSLRDFHKQLREYPAKAQLIPMPVDAGLDRVLRTLGQIDLIVWSEKTPPTDSQKVLLTRLSKPTTMLFSMVNDRWEESQLTVDSRQKAA